MECSAELWGKLRTTGNPVSKKHVHVTFHMVDRDDVKKCVLKDEVQLPSEGEVSFVELTGPEIAATE